MQQLLIYLARSFVRWKQVSTSAEIRCFTLLLTCVHCFTLLLYFGTRAYLFSPDEGSRYVFSKHLFRVSCILWWYYSKCYSIMLHFLIEFRLDFRGETLGSYASSTFWLIRTLLKTHFNDYKLQWPPNIVVHFWFRLTLYSQNSPIISWTLVI